MGTVLALALFEFFINPIFSVFYSPLIVMAKKLEKLERFWILFSVPRCNPMLPFKKPMLPLLKVYYSLNHRALTEGEKCCLSLVYIYRVAINPGKMPPQQDTAVHLHAISPRFCYLETYLLQAAFVEEPAVFDNTDQAPRRRRNNMQAGC